MIHCSGTVIRHTGRLIAVGSSSSVSDQSHASSDSAVRPPPPRFHHTVNSQGWNPFFEHDIDCNGPFASVRFVHSS